MMPAVLAIAAHPDDIEFCMAGTMLRLVERGWEAHYFNLANGCCGSTELNREDCATTRLAEAQAAANMLPAVFHAPICNDMEIFYTLENLKKVASVIRQARPSIILTHAPIDYMEDHQNTSRLTVSAAFCKGMPNFESDPPAETAAYDVAIYHAQPHSNMDQLYNPVHPTHFVDVTELIDKKQDLLACHASQKGWLDETQGMGSYIQTMVDLNKSVGQLSESYGYSEGWRKHLHYGYGKADFDPLATELGDQVMVRPVLA